MLYRLRSIDKVPEPVQRATSLGTLVHAVLENLFDVPAAERTPERARTMIAPLWDAMVEQQAELADLVADMAAKRAFFDDAAARLGTYFTLENPQRLEPAGRELRLEAQLEGGPALRGVIDRLDVAPDGQTRVIDYKTGALPRPQYGSQAEFQLRFYALLLERSRGQLPTLMRLLYLKDGGVKELRPTEADLSDVTERITVTWSAITAHALAGDFPPKPSRLCSWCSFQALCPEFGGTPPQLDADAVERATGVRPAPRPKAR